jgi:hypothetical protein
MNTSYLRRTQKGRPIPMERATAVDVVARLSKTNHTAVVKVFAALDALQKHLGICSLEAMLELIDITAAPIEAARFDGTDEERVESTERLASAVAHDPSASPYQGFLHLARFQQRSTVD